MAVSNLQPTYVGPLTWRLTWTSDIAGATFRLFRDGVQVGSTNATEWTITVAPGESPSVDVLDDADDQPEAAYPSHVILAWGPSTPSAASYRVDKLVGAKWIEQGIVSRGRDDQSYFEFRTVTLADDTTHVFRVVPILNGVDGFPSEHRMLMVRLPDPPDVRYAFDRLTGKIAVTQATSF